MRTLLGWFWSLVGKLPQGHDPWNGVEEHPDEQTHRR